MNRLLVPLISLLPVAGLAIPGSVKAAVAPPAHHSHGVSVKSHTLASVAYIHRGVGVQPPHKKMRKGKLRMALFSQYFLKTKASQKASIRFKDGTTIHMNQRTEFVLRSPSLTLVKHGEVAEFLAPGTNHQIKTGTAVAAAIGTTYDVRQQGKKSFFIVLHGVLQVKNRYGKVLVRSNHESIAVPHRAPTRPKAINAKTAFAWTDSIPTPDLGENIALDANGGVAAASSEAGNQWRASHINDGLLSTGWESADGRVTDQRVRFAFYFGASSFRIQEIIIDPAATGGTPSDMDLKDFQIRVSSTNLDESSFSTVYTGRTLQKNELQHFKLPVPVVAKYVELVALNNYGNPNRIAVAEMEVVATTGAFDTPGGAAADSHGNIFVADTYNDRVQKLSPQGVVLKSWGTKGYGPGQFRYPEDVAIDRQDNVYVADEKNNRIEKFSPSGVFITQFGSFGLGPGQFRRPEGVAVDDSGNIYVSDTGTARIQKLSPTGAPLAQWGQFGSQPGQFSVPQGIALDRQGNIYVADSGNDRIQKLSPNGDPLAQYGTHGTDAGQFDTPYGIAVDARGFLYVADTFNDRIQKLSPSGAPVSSWGKTGFGEGEFILPARLHLDESHGKLLVPDLGNARVSLFALKDNSFIDQYGTFGTIPQALGSPYGIALDSDGNVYVTDGDNHRVQMRTPSGQVFAVFGRHGLAAGQTGSLGQFSLPEGVAVDRLGYIYVADTFNDRIQVLSQNGPITAWGGGPEPDHPSFSHPFDVTVDKANNVYVADGGNNRIVKLSPEGRVLDSFGSQGTGLGQFDEPRGVAVDGQGNIYVADSGNNRIQKLSPSGRPLLAWGTSGSDAGQFDTPSGVAIDPQGHVDVVDTFNDRIQRFTSAGVYVDEVSLGFGENRLQAPHHIAIDPQGNIYIADTQNLRIVKLGPDGSVKSVWE